ncbi:hypothetical protein [Nocardioides sp. LML1-1-1.1]|uniref:hypothetical protein n=1 Tax=Nocardioides sp. LML1-1-1.1 TaxID=3135248 RepID=UPI0034162EE7
MTTHRPRARVAPEDDLAEVLTRALRERGRSLTWLRDRLQARGVRVSLSALSYWRSGRRRPEGAASVEALAAIEELLDLRPGALIDRTGPSRRTGAVARTAPVEAVADNSSAALLARALDDLGLADAPTRAADETASFTVDLDEHGCFARVRGRFRVRAVHERVDRVPLWLVVDRPVPRPITVGEVHGATPGRRVDDLAAGLLVQEVVLDRPLLSGEATVVEATFDVPSEEGAADVDTEFVLSPPRRTGEIELWVRFRRTHVPATCTLRSAALAGATTEVAVDLREVSSVHHAVRAFGPGTVGIHWTW